MTKMEQARVMAWRLRILQWAEGEPRQVGTGATIDPSLVSIDSGEDLLSEFEMPPGIRRQLCSTCGCSLFYFHHAYPSLMFYFPATLDDGVHPGHHAGLERHICVDSRALVGILRQRPAAPRRRLAGRGIPGSGSINVQ